MKHIPKSSKTSAGGVSRRSLLKITSVAAGMVALGTRGVRAARDLLSARKLQESAPLACDPDVNVVHSVCLGCNTRCGSRAVVRNGVIEKMSGNPFHPYNSFWHAPSRTTRR